MIRTRSSMPTRKHSIAVLVSLWLVQWVSLSISPSSITTKNRSLSRVLYLVIYTSVLIRASTVKCGIHFFGRLLMEVMTLDLVSL